MPSTFPTRQQLKSGVPAKTPDEMAAWWARVEQARAGTGYVPGYLGQSTGGQQTGGGGAGFDPVTGVRAGVNATQPTGSNVYGPHTGSSGPLPSSQQLATGPTSWERRQAGDYSNYGLGTSSKVMASGQPTGGSAMPAFRPATQQDLFLGEDMSRYPKAHANIGLWEQQTTSSGEEVMNYGGYLLTMDEIKNLGSGRQSVPTGATPQNNYGVTPDMMTPYGGGYGQQDPSIYQPGSTAGTYPTAQIDPTQTLQQPTQTGGGSSGFTDQYNYFTDPSRVVGYDGGNTSGVSWGDQYMSGGGNLNAAMGRNASGQLVDQFGNVIPEPSTGTAAQGSSGFGPVGNQLWNQYQDAYNQGVETNEQRYEDILGGYRDRYGQSMDMVNQMGTSQRAEIDRVYGGRAASEQQRLVDMGLGTSSISTTNAMGVDRERLRANQELEDSLLSQRLGVHSGQSGDTLGFMERRTDSYPDLNQLIDLALKLGNTQGASGTGLASPVAASASQFGYNIPGQAWGQTPANTGSTGSSGAVSLTQSSLAAATAALNDAGQNPTAWRQAVERGQDPRQIRD